MNFSVEEIEYMFDDYQTRFRNYVTSNRLESILQMVNEYKDKLYLAPASVKESYHNAFPGGLLEHLLRVHDIAIELFEMYKKFSTKIDYTEEEITVCALLHDFGKLGDLDNDLFIVQDDEWRKNKLGEIYKYNISSKNGLPNMRVYDRTLFILQKYIKLSYNEYLAIRTQDGLYDDSNKFYFINYDHNFSYQSNLCLLIHTADLMACRFEYERFLLSENERPSKSFYSNKSKKSKTLQDAFAKKNTDNVVDVIKGNGSKMSEIDLDTDFSELFSNITE